MRRSRFSEQRIAVELKQPKPVISVSQRKASCGPDLRLSTAVLVIFYLKRCFGLDRCTWRSLNSFKSYVWASIFSFNLLTLARHKLA